MTTLLSFLTWAKNYKLLAAGLFALVLLAGFGTYRLIQNPWDNFGRGPVRPVKPVGPEVDPKEAVTDWSSCTRKKIVKYCPRVYEECDKEFPPERSRSALDDILDSLKTGE